MAKLAAQFEYTDAELLALYREAVAKVSVAGKSYSIAGRTFTAADLPAMWETIATLEARINSSSGPVFNLARITRQ